MVYDLAPQQGKIPFAIQRTRRPWLPSFGEKLKQEREKRKISLEDISVSTKIGTRMLQALEEDKFNQLPGGIFNKGFVRAYSRFVGLDEDQTVAEYLQASGDAPPPRTEIVSRDEAREDSNEENVDRVEASSDSPARNIPWGLLAAALLVVAILLALWSHHQRAKHSADPQQSETKTETKTSASPQLSSAASKDQSRPETGTSPASRTGPTDSPATSKNAAATAPATLPTVVRSGPAAPGEFTVDVQVREDSWISITADGKLITSGLLPAGSERSDHARKEIIVKAGNVGGVDLHFNGKKIAAGGEYGEVKTVTFGPGGIVPNAPAPPATP
jgi:cytoskeleton protein RodZ